MRDALMYAAGLGFLTLAKTKNVLQGYTSPKVFDLSDTDRAVRYDVKVVAEWLLHLKSYTGSDSVAGKHVLELGPGSDLGVGLCLLAKGAATYNACDVNNLIESAPDSFYTALFDRLAAADRSLDIENLKIALQAARTGAASPLKFVHRQDFDLTAAFAPSSIDLVFSQAAFEHFDDVGTTIAKLSAVCKSGATIVAVIDLKTHSRWIRVKDPNNIYRYSDWLYRGFWFRGSPNRVRPYQYKAIFEGNDWTDVFIAPLEQIKEPRLRALNVDRQFRDTRNQLEYLSIILCARKR